MHTTTTTYPQPAPVFGQQTVIVAQPTAPTVNYVSAVPQAPGQDPGTAEHFNGPAGRSTGWIQLCCGIGSIIVTIAQIVLHSSLSYSGFGIWAGVAFYIPSGILGIVSYHKRSCVIIGYMTMSILSCLIAFSMMIAGAVSASVNDLYYCEDWGFTYENCAPGIQEGRIACDSILSIIGLIQLITAIVASAFCCGGVCCGRTTPTVQRTTLITTGTPMVVTSMNTGNQIGQPPPYTNQQLHPVNPQPPQYPVSGQPQSYPVSGQPQSYPVSAQPQSYPVPAV